MNNDVQRFLCLIDELDTSHKLICSGFGSLQEIDIANNFYHLPHQLMASGIERLMKCYIALVHHDRMGSFPDMAFMKALGHDLVSLHEKVRKNHYGGTTRPIVEDELRYLTNDRTLHE